MSDTLIEMERISSTSLDCSLVEPAGTGGGGVDPLGLRQINFDLMNEVFPGLNNVARHIRPFTVVTWAWRRTISLALERGAKLPVSVHEDFVARIEVAFVWSMLQYYESADIDLPGKQRISSIWGDAKSIKFGDDAWNDFVTARRNSTALTAAINYGPGLRALGFLVDDLDQPRVRIPGAATDSVLDAFEARLRPILNHKVFRGWDACTLKRSTAEEWAEIWDMDDLLVEEREAMGDRLIGERASLNRRGGFKLLTQSLAEVDVEGDDSARHEMYENDDAEVGDEVLLWRRIQVRQAFRLALETLFEWIIAEIDGGTLNTKALAERLLKQSQSDPDVGAFKWFQSLASDGATPVEAMDNLQACFPTGEGIGVAALKALAVAVMCDPVLFDRSERRERLPIAQAAADLARYADESPERFVEHVIESWVIAQHTYWSVGRGLADARAGGRHLKVCAPDNDFSDITGTDAIKPLIEGTGRAFPC
jgi:hypothetical protein